MRWQQAFFGGKRHTMSTSTTDSVLRNHFSPDQPFGPINASRITDPDAFRQLFDTENKVYSELTSHPSLSLIVGRRGSGKTALLRSELLRQKHAITLELPAAESFQQVVKLIQGFQVRVSPAESVSKVWNLILWTALLSEICSQPDRGSGTETIRRFLTALELPVAHDPYLTMRQLLRRIRRYADESTDGDAIDAAYDFANRLEFDGVTFQAARASAIEYLADHGGAVILMDSLDDFRLELEENQNSLKGLLRCQAEFHAPKQPCSLRCCLPGELMHSIYMKLSDNPLKDFGNKLDVTWTSEELQRIAAHRFKLYIQFYYPEAFKSEFQHYHFDKRHHVSEFWQRVMPEKIKNRFDVFESPTAMILRHTQLLPRQLLVILNAIAVKNHRLTGNGQFSTFEAQAVSEGLQEAENTICREVFNAYRSTFPNAEEICKRCMPFLPSRFRDGELHSVYNRHGKAVPYASDYEEFRDILVAIGAVGKVVDETGIYVKGEFIYNTDSNLSFTGNELLCVHPVFSRVFNQGVNADTSAPKVVYPHPVDTDID